MRQQWGVRVEGRVRSRGQRCQGLPPGHVCPQPAPGPGSAQSRRSGPATGKQPRGVAGAGWGGGGRLGAYGEKPCRTARAHPGGHTVGCGTQQPLSSRPLRCHPCGRPLERGAPPRGRACGAFCLAAGPPGWLGGRISPFPSEGSARGRDTCCCAVGTRVRGPCSLGSPSSTVSESRPQETGSLTRSRAGEC